MPSDRPSLMPSLFRTTRPNSTSCGHIGVWNPFDNDVSVLRDKLALYLQHNTGTINAYGTVRLAVGMSNLASFDNIFQSTSFDEHLSFWDTKKVTLMKGFFQAPISTNLGCLQSCIFQVYVRGGALFLTILVMDYISSDGKWTEQFAPGVTKFNGDVSSIQTGNLVQLAGAFKNSDFIRPLASWNTAKLTKMSDLFSGRNFNQDISGWSVSEIIAF